MSEQSGFQLSGSAPEMYERYIVSPLCIALAEDLVSLAALNPGGRILDVASISYQEGSAMGIPCPDETFDVVFCQHGLEFFPDRGQSLREKQEGRLGFRVWSPLEHQPFHVAVLAALDRHHWGSQDVPSRTVFTQAFSLWNAEELRTVVVDAGFRNIELRVSTIPW